MTKKSPSTAKATQSEALTIETVCAKFPEYRHLIEMMGIVPGRALVAMVDGHYVIEGRFDLTAERAGKILNQYAYRSNRRIRKLNTEIMARDMREGKWSGISDPGVQFALADELVAISNGHHRFGTAADIEALNDHPLNMRFCLTTAPLAIEYGKHDIGANKTRKDQAIAAKFPERLQLSTKATRSLIDLTIAVISDGGVRLSKEDRISINRLDTLYEQVERCLPIYRKLMAICPDRKFMYGQEMGSSYGGLFTTKERWEVMTHRSFYTALIRVARDNPDLEDAVLEFARKLVDFSTDCRQLSSLYHFYNLPVNVAKGSTNYDSTFNATLVCLRDFLNQTPTEDLSPISFGSKLLRDKEETRWSSTGKDVFVDVSFEIEIGNYKRAISAWKVQQIGQKTKKVQTSRVLAAV